MAGVERIEVSMAAQKIIIKGIVQGVGFRPFIYRLAREYGLRGTVSNNAHGVDIEAEGDFDSIRAFVREIDRSAPPLALIDSIETRDIPPEGYTDFMIQTSDGSDDRFTLISPDVTVCNDCLKEIFDPDDRRYRYPFINCTNCGPRFTIIQDIPYDRPYTTMSVFPMCPDCLREYNDPADRRFHAQPNACPVCGPQLRLSDTQNIPVATEDVLRAAAALLIDGKIIAIKGLGGFHLACDATNGDAIALLRERKRRIEKPFAVMIPRIEDLETLCDATSEESALLRSIQRPIVLIRRKANSPVSRHVAPRNPFIGVMLPYTPLHHVLLRETNVPLVMTSGNISEEPIAYRDDEALERLSDIADYFLTHNREIHMRCDDSVAAILNKRPSILRRSRGYVPYPVKLHVQAEEPILAVGGHLKNTFCILRESYAFMSHHIGDLENYETLRSFMEGIEHFTNMFSVKPTVLAYDMHPEYLSTKYALQSDSTVKIPVQHHHAHIVSCMTENNLTGTVIGVAFDGTGYGTDGNIWGGEFMTVTPGEFERRAHFDYFPLPGGEQAIKEPQRVAYALLREVSGIESKNTDIPFMRSFRETKMLPVLDTMIDRRIQSPLTSAAGRLFDGVAALCDVRKIINYEAQAAIEFQMLADESVTGYYDYDVDSTGGPRKIKWQPIVQQIVRDLGGGIPVPEVSGKFHNTLAGIIADISHEIGTDTGIRNVLLSGGVFQNSVLVEKTVRALQKYRLNVYTHSRVPPNDGGLSLGQAVAALSKR
jgi:hydrogenase maturation protein HypF